MQLFRLGVPLAGLIVASGVLASSTSWARAASLQRHPLAFIRPDLCGQPLTDATDLAGGQLLLPHCNRVSGRLTYGANDGSSSFVLSAFRVNPAPSVCGSASGQTVVEYVLLTRTGSDGGFEAVKVGSKIKSHAFASSTGFQLWVYSAGSWLFYYSLSSPNAKGIVKFRSPLNGWIPVTGVTYCLEFVAH